MFRTAGAQLARVLQGARTADLPVVQPTKFELVINSRPKVLGFSVPSLLLASADKVIE
jgi:putative tryptophan/tyrosine transport system substrate-binding protein